MNAIELLISQHEEALESCRELSESSAGAARRERFRWFQRALLAHMEIEEEHFYPATARAHPDNEPVIEAYENHASERAALDRCEKALLRDDLFHVRMLVLRQMLAHHMEEEQRGLFPRATQELSSVQLEILGAQMESSFLRAQSAASPAEKLNALSTSRELRVLAL